MIVTADAPPSVRLSGPGWRTEWLLGIAEAIGAAADCTRRRVGAVLAAPDSFQILGGGYNGLAAGRPGCLTAGACPRGRRSYEEVPGLVTPYGPGVGSCEAQHAEEGAVRRALEAGHDVTGAVMAVTDEPCPGCRTLLARHGLGLVVWPGGRWEPNFEDLRFVRVQRPAPRGEETVSA